MIRTALVILGVFAVVAAAIALQGDPGLVRFTWRGWDITTTAAATVLLLLVVTLVFLLSWRGLLWVSALPRRLGESRAARRRQDAGQALEQGFLALAGGDAAEARRLADQALIPSTDPSSLTLLLAAEAAAASEDHAAARAAYDALALRPEGAAAARQGLARLASSQLPTTPPAAPSALASEPRPAT